MLFGAVSVDLDAPRHYLRIHALDGVALDARATALVGQVAVPRLLELFERARVGATFFAIGEELAEPHTRAAVQDAAARGVEIENHSFAHDYALSRRPRAEIAADLAAAHAAIAEVTGRAPRGFRAPGYTLSQDLLAAVADQGYAWDSSAFPAAPYYAAKAGVMAALRLLGRPSGAVLDRPRVLLAPRTPYHPDREEPYRRGDAPLLELPMAVVPGVRVPFIGTLVTSAPWPLVRRAFAALAQDAFVNLELHALDVLDESDGLPPALVARQRDAAVPARTKLARLEEVLRWMAAQGPVVTVDEAARRLGATNA